MMMMMLTTNSNNFSHSSIKQFNEIIFFHPITGSDTKITTHTHRWRQTYNKKEKHIWSLYIVRLAFFLYDASQRKILLKQWTSSSNSNIYYINMMLSVCASACPRSIAHCMARSVYKWEKYRFYTLFCRQTHIAQLRKRPKRFEHIVSFLWFSFERINTCKLRSFVYELVSI